MNNKHVITDKNVTKPTQNVYIVTSVRVSVEPRYPTRVVRFR